MPLDFVGTPRHRWTPACGVGIEKLFQPRERAIDEKARTIDVVVSTGTRDRDGDIVEPSGWNLAPFSQNPVVLFNHDHNRPIARALKIGVDGDRLVATVKFPAPGVSALSDEVFGLYQEGVLNAVSAGFMPDEMEPISDAPDDPGMRFTKQTLWEFSAVSVPSNPDALVAPKATKLSDVERNARARRERARQSEIVAKAIGRVSDDADVEALNKVYVQITRQSHPRMEAILMNRNKAAQKATADEVSVGASVSFEYGVGQIVGIAEDGSAADVRIYMPEGDEYRPTDAVLSVPLAALTPTDPLPVMSMPDDMPDDEADPAQSRMGDDMQDDEDEHTGKAQVGDEFATSEDEGHSHAFLLGDTETAEANGHVHAIIYDSDGRAEIEPVDGHNHTAPADAVVDAENAMADEEEMGAAETMRSLSAAIADLSARVSVVEAAAAEKAATDPEVEYRMLMQSVCLGLAPIIGKTISTAVRDARAGMSN